MRGPARDRLRDLTSLQEIDDADQREASWRQGLATLAAAVTNQRRPVPLEGFDPEDLRISAGLAIKYRYVENLDWLSPPAAAAALYELAAALPPSKEKREIGRHVLTRVHEGDAATFIAVATRLALSSPKALNTPEVLARIALALHLPLGTSARPDGLAFALISRRELSRQWLRERSIGSLPERRLAARLLESAAREAARRAAEGDDSGVRVFCSNLVRDAWDRLLADRESLVWRHVAAARGILSTAMPAFSDEVQRHMGTDFSITEWRRAAASAAAHMTIDPEEGYQWCQQILDSVIFEQDKGVAAAMIFGLPHAADSHPDQAQELLNRLVGIEGIDIAEALVSLRHELSVPSFASKAALKCRAQLQATLDRHDSDDEGRRALINGLIDDLNERPHEEYFNPKTLRDTLQHSLRVFIEKGAPEAAKLAPKALDLASRAIDELETCEDPSAQKAFSTLYEIDQTLLETNVLAELLDLEDQRKANNELGDFYQRITNWIVIHEGDPIATSGPVEQFTTRMRRLRTMLHLVDADGPRIDTRLQLLRQRRLLAAKVLLHRVLHDPKTPLRRALCAATSRACDALVREEVVEVSDIVIATATYVPHLEGIRTMSEASMMPEIDGVLSAYARFHKAVARARDAGRFRPALDALRTLGNELPVARSPRVEALRNAFLLLARELRIVSSSDSLLELAEASIGTPLALLEQSIENLLQLIAGSRRRFGDPATESMYQSPYMLRALGIELERVLRADSGDLSEITSGAANTAREEIPGAIGEILAICLERLGSLPIDAPRRKHSSMPPSSRREVPLPAWIPPSRTLGGFYIVRPVGTGAVGSVFVARRIEERQDESATHFALKVPDYSGAVARTISEEEFFRLFREEAGALLALPEHPNIARFVTFDVGAKPNPILVMELVEGPSLERMIETRDLTVSRALDLLLGVSAGLESMHRVGVAHLDVKSANIIVRDPEGFTRPDHPLDPVLVDFGLAGRKLRPGCGTAQYGAPEIWGAGDVSQAIPADVYALGCLIYEVLTSQTLFSAPNEAAIIAAHISHDGEPEGIAKLSRDARLEGLVDLLRRCLRQNPVDRVTIEQARRMLANLRPQLNPLSWPIQANVA